MTSFNAVTVCMNAVLTDSENIGLIKGPLLSAWTYTIDSVRRKCAFLAHYPTWYPPHRSVSLAPTMNKRRQVHMHVVTWNSICARALCPIQCFFFFLLSPFSYLVRIMHRGRAFRPFVTTKDSRFKNTRLSKPAR